MLLVCVVGENHAGGIMDRIFDAKKPPRFNGIQGLEVSGCRPNLNMKHMSLTLALLSLTNISVGIAAKKNLIIDTDLFSDVE